MEETGTEDNDINSHYFYHSCFTMIVSFLYFLFFYFFFVREREVLKVLAWVA